MGPPLISTETTEKGIGEPSVAVPEAIALSILAAGAGGGGRWGG